MNGFRCMGIPLEVFLPSYIYPAGWLVWVHSQVDR